MNAKHCTSLELSKALKEAGIAQESEFYWTLYTGQWKLISKQDLDNLQGAGTMFANYAAFLASELGELLPPGYTTSHTKLWWYCMASDEKMINRAKSMPESMGKMLLYLTQHNLWREV